MESSTPEFYCRVIEAITGVREQVVNAISLATTNCLTDTDIGMGKKRVVSVGRFLSHACKVGAIT